MEHSFDHRWHLALNHAVINAGRWPELHWMYEAKNLAREASRLVALFKAEREGTLPKIHRQCSLSAPEPVPDNHLTCCLGTACRECPMLLALEPDLAGEELDTARAWTCATHIAQEAGRHSVDTSEGYILTTDDRMFWDRYMAMDPDETNKEQP